MNPISTDPWTDGCRPPRALSNDAAIAETAAEFGLDTYPNQIEIITSEQMLDAYASSGLPIGYPHWSYGKAFIRNEQAYRKGSRASPTRSSSTPIPASPI